MPRLTSRTTVGHEASRGRHGAAALLVRSATLCAVAWLAVVGIAACGTGSHDDPAIAQVGKYTITKSLLDQWMTPTIGEDFYAVMSRQAPVGLVAEPADYPACVTTLKKLTPVPGDGPARPQPTAAELDRRCRQLYEAIRYQTLTFLVKAYWSINFAASHGITATTSEVQHQLERVEAIQYSAPGQLKNYLTSHSRTLQQQLFELKLELLQEKLLHKALASGEHAALAVAAEAQGQSSPASCGAGDIVEHCKGYKAPGGYPGPPPSTQLAEIARWRPPEPSHTTTSPSKPGSAGPGLVPG
jgi:hypothetical protein